MPYDTPDKHHEPKAEKPKPDKFENDLAKKAAADRETHAKALSAQREAEQKASIERIKEAQNIKIGPDHPLHPSRATNPSNLTSPVTHDPFAPPVVTGEGEP